MADETPKADPTMETPQIAAPADTATNGFPTESLQKDVVMSDAPVDQPAVCSSSSIPDFCLNSCSQAATLSNTFEKRVH
jgi:hypothetical protein